MSQIKLTNDQIKIVSGVGAGVVALIVGVLLWKSSRSKEEPEYVEDSDELEIERPSEASTVDLNIRNNRDDDDDDEEEG
jgi:hypothetical protein